MHELPVTSLSTVNPGEPGSFQVGDQLANLARHTGETTSPRPRCASPKPRLRIRKITSLRLALVKTSDIGGLTKRSRNLHALFGFLGRVTRHPVIEAGPL